MAVVHPSDSFPQHVAVLHREKTVLHHLESAQRSALARKAQAHDAGDEPPFVLKAMARCSILFVLLSLSVPVGSLYVLWTRYEFPPVEIELGFSQFRVDGHPSAVNDDTFRAVLDDDRYVAENAKTASALASALPVFDSELLAAGRFEPQTYQGPNTVLASEKRPFVSQELTIIVLYKGGNALQKPYVELLRRVEQQVLAHPRFGDFCVTDPVDTSLCRVPDSATNFFYPTRTSEAVIFDGRGAVINDFDDTLATMSSYLVGGGRIGFFERDFEKTGTTQIIVSTIAFADSPSRSPAATRTFIGEFEAILSDANEEFDEITLAYTGGVLEANQLNSALTSDATLAIYSLVFIFGFIFIKTSFFHAVAGLTNIIMAFIPSVLIHRYFFGVGMSMLNVLSLWLILGIGADDVFVFMSDWKLAKHLKEHRARRLAFTYRHAGFAMFVTSVTTAMAFYGTGMFSSIPAIRQFGFLMGNLVSFNYLGIVTFFPSCVAMLDSFPSCRPCKVCRRGGGAVDDDHSAPTTITEKLRAAVSFSTRVLLVWHYVLDGRVKGPVGWRASEVRCVKLPDKPLEKQHRPDFLLRFVWIAGCLVVVAWFALKMTELRPPSEPIQILPDGHNIEVLRKLRRDFFVACEDCTYTYGTGGSTPSNQIPIDKGDDDNDLNKIIARPSAVQDFTVSDVRPSQMLVSWRKPLHEGVLTGTTLLSYKATIRSLDTPPTISTTTTTTTATAVALGPLQFNASYSVSVVASNALGDGPSSQWLNVTTSLPLSALTVSTQSYTSIGLSWALAANAGLTSLQLNGRDLDTTATSASETGLQLGSAYVFELVATNAVGSSQALSVSTSTLPLPDPAPAHRVTVTSITTDAVSITWTDQVVPSQPYNGPPLLFELFAWVDGAFSRVLEPTALTSHTFTGLCGGTNITAYVLSSNPFHNATVGPTSTALTDKAAPPPPGYLSVDVYNASLGGFSVNVGGVPVSACTNGDALVNATVIARQVSGGAAAVYRETVLTLPATVHFTGLPESTAFAVSVVVTNTYGSSPETVVPPSSALFVSSAAPILNRMRPLGAVSTRNAAAAEAAVVATISTLAVPPPTLSASGVGESFVVVGVAVSSALPSDALTVFERHEFELWHVSVTPPVLVDAVNSTVRAGFVRNTTGLLLGELFEARVRTVVTYASGRVIASVPALLQVRTRRRPTPTPALFWQLSGTRVFLFSWEFVPAQRQVDFAATTYQLEVSQTFNGEAPTSFTVITPPDFTDLSFVYVPAQGVSGSLFAFRLAANDGFGLGPYNTTVVSQFTTVPPPLVLTVESPDFQNATIHVTPPTQSGGLPLLGMNVSYGTIEPGKPPSNITNLTLPPTATHIPLTRLRAESVVFVSGVAFNALGPSAVRADATIETAEAPCRNPVYDQGTNEATFCGGRGVCDVSSGTCTCQTGYLGSGCELECPAIISTVAGPRPCSDNGLCDTDSLTGEAFCRCDDGIAPPFCNSTTGAGTSDIYDIREGWLALKIDIMWGVTGVDTSAADKTDPIGSPGTPIYDDRFDMAHPNAQRHLFRYCKTWLSSQATALNLQLSDTLDRSRCLILQFEDFVRRKGHAFPVTNTTSFHLLLDDFIFKTSNGAKFKDDIGLEPQFGVNPASRVKWLRARLFVDQANDAAAAKLESFYDKWTEIVDDMNAAGPPQANRAFQTAEQWPLAITELAFVRGVVGACAVSIFVSFASVLVFTGDVIITLFVTFGVLCVVVIVLGFFVVNGMELGPVEAVSVSVVVGLAVDPLIHLGHKYVEFERPDRFSRAHWAVVLVGSSVLSAALTTVGATSIILLCQITLFSTFGVIAAFTAASSIFVALVLFLGLLTSCGPQRNFLSIRAIVTAFWASRGKHQMSILERRARMEEREGWVPPFGPHIESCMSEENEDVNDNTDGKEMEGPPVVSRKRIPFCTDATADGLQGPFTLTNARRRPDPALVVKGVDDENDDDDMDDEKKVGGEYYDDGDGDGDGDEEKEYRLEDAEKHMSQQLFGFGDRHVPYVLKVNPFRFVNPFSTAEILQATADGLRGPFTAHNCYRTDDKNNSSPFVALNDCRVAVSANASFVSLPDVSRSQSNADDGPGTPGQAQDDDVSRSQSNADDGPGAPGQAQDDERQWNTSSSSSSLSAADDDEFLPEDAEEEKKL